MDPDEPFGYVVSRGFYTLLGRYDEALKIIEKAATIAPNDLSVVRMNGLAEAVI